jgi:hypothetical protein
MSTRIRAALLALALALGAACDRETDEPGAPTPPPADLNRTPEQRDIARAGDALFAKIAARDYDGAYESASDAFKASNSRGDFVKKMQELELFGKLTKADQKDAPELADDGGRHTAKLRYTARYTLGEGPFDVTLAADPSGDWRLDYYKYDVQATTSDPPYPADEAGAERLAHRFLYLWQTRRYGELADTMELDGDEEEDKQRLDEFFKELETAGRLLTMKRTAFSANPKAGPKAVSLDYDLTFDNGAGWIRFQLEQDGDQWRITDAKDAVRYDVEYFTGK